MQPSALMNTYVRQPLAFVSGAGAWLTDAEGRRYLDGLSGIAVCNLGHSHPRVAAALAEQAGRLLHTSNLYEIPLQERLGARLCALADMDAAFLCNSGAEANEAALKLARLHGHARGVDMPAVIVMEDSFHGRTLATLSATGNRRVQAGFEPLVQGFVRAPFGDLGAIETIAANAPNVVAVLVEPIQGEGGVRLAPPDYLPGLASLCQRHGWLLMLDEVQTGMGRTGHWFAHQASGVHPDVMTLAKALGNGVPIGACLARGAAARLFQPGSHGSTFGGNPLASAAALAVVATLESERLVQRAEAAGTLLLGELQRGLVGVAGVREVRGRGLMLGIELDRDCGEVVALAREQGLLVNVTAGRVIRLLPPLVITDAELRQLSTTLCAVVRSFLGQPSS